MERLLIYIAGPYSASTPEGIAENVHKAAQAGIAIMQKGHHVICPHSMTHNWDNGTGLTWDDFMSNHVDLMERSDAICLIDGWQESEGALVEEHFAKLEDMAIFYGVDEVPRPEDIETVSCCCEECGCEAECEVGADDD